MTWRDVLNQYYETTTSNDIADYRINVSMHVNDLENRFAIRIWFKNGASILYYPYDDDTISASNFFEDAPESKLADYILDISPRTITEAVAEDKLGAWCQSIVRNMLIELSEIVSDKKENENEDNE